MKYSTMNRKPYRFSTLALLVICVALLGSSLQSCAPANVSPTGTAAISDSAMFATANAGATGYTWYKNSDAYLAKASASGHTEALLRTRYNSVAATQLDANGRVRAGIVFPEGSIIIKELADGNRALNTYAMLWKRKDDPNADDTGWVWGYVRANGSARASVTGKGSGCITCHSGAGSIDRTRMNVAQP